MHISSSRRGFLRGLVGASALGMGGCFSIGKSIGDRKIRLAAVGVGGKGYSDWTPMLKTGMAEMVAFCDADRTIYESCIQKAAKDGLGDLSKVPYYSDYRDLLANAGALGIDAMTVSTPDHVHAAVAIQAMKQGIHVYVQKPLVRTLWELDYFNRTAKDEGVIVQMGNQGSSLDSMRRCTEVIQSGILGEVKEVHVWTNRAVWPQGDGVANYVKSRGDKGDPVRNGLDWNAWLGPAKNRPFLDKYPKGAKVYDPWRLGQNVYHSFTWRGFHDFGAGAFGDMACHTMNLPFRGLELAGVSDAECIKIEQKNDIAYPSKSIVKLTYKARKAKFGQNAGKTLAPVTLFWYDGYDEDKPAISAMKPSKDIMPKVLATYGEIPNTGCYIIGSEGAVLMQDDYGAKCAIALNADAKFVDVFKHPAAIAVKQSIPLCKAPAAAGGDQKSTVEMKGFAEGHYGEFLRAIKGIGPVYEQTNSRCFSDIEYCIPQMEGILVGCIAQQVAGKHLWNSATQTFGDAAAQALVKPYIRKGFEF